MKVIVTVSQDGGRTYDEVGMKNRMLISDLKSVWGVRRRARDYARGKNHRLEYFTDSGFYGEPFRVEFCPVSLQP